MSKPDIQTFVEALWQKPKFVSDRYVNKLQSATRTLGSVRDFSSLLPNPDPPQNNATIDGQDCTSILSPLAIATCADGMSRVNMFGFNSTVNGGKTNTEKGRFITSMVPYCFADDIDEFLKSKSLPVLNSLKSNQTLIDAYAKNTQSQAFIKAVEDADRTEGSSYRGAMFLFINQFFQTQGNYSILTKLPVDPSPNSVISVSRLWFNVLQQGSKGSAQTTANNLAYVSACLTPFLAHDNLPEKDVNTLTLKVGQAIQNSGQSTPLLDELVKNLGRGVGVFPNGGEFYNLYSGHIDAVWDSRSQPYVEAMKSVIGQTNVTVTEEKVPYTVCHGGPAASCSILYNHYKITRSIYGDRVAAWIADNQGSGCFNSGPPSPDARTTVSKEQIGGGGGGSCFVPGTLVTVKGGVKPIEKLIEGDEILTMANPTQYGTRSDEVVAIPTGSGKKKMKVFGFNKEEPFFTPDHVLYTTTGMRAINPQAAMRENPWLKVGRLQAGHKLLRLNKTGDNYETIEILTLHSKTVKSDFVYGVHLHEGLRSYHANGYLVRLNYPEITIKSLAKDLLSLPKQIRRKMITAAKEMVPLLKRFGGETVIEAFEKEIKQDDLPSKLFAGVPPVPKCFYDLSAIHRTWYLHGSDSIGNVLSERPSKLPLSISVDDGVVSVEDKYCEKATIHEGSVHWTRQVSENSWEHGGCFIFPEAAFGQGYIFHSDNADELEPAPKEQRITFQATLHPGESTPTQTVSNGTTNGAVSHVASIEKVSTNLAARELKYAISLDDGKPLFDVISTSTSPQQSAIICNDLRVPFLDDLLAKLKQNMQNNEKLPLPPQSISRLYEPSFTILQDKENKNELLYEINLVHPEMVYIASDEYTGENPKATYRNLTFNKIGFPGTLAVLPTKFSYKLEWDAETLNGKLLAYDPIKQGTYGDEINIHGNYVRANNATQARSTAVEAAHSSFIASQKAPGSSRALFEAHATPSSAALSIATSKTGPAELKLQTLWGLDFSSGELQTAGQDLIYKCMLYHINDADRNFYFHESKPTNLNPMLGENLSSELKAWVLNTYAPAFIGNQIMLADDVTKNTWRRPFTKDEEKKIVYFWEGKGKTCLARSAEYKVLNETAARAATINLSKGVMEDFIKDGGDKWAEALWKNASGEPQVGNLVDNFRMNAGDSKLSKICNILNALNKDTEKSNDLAALVRKDVEAELWNTQYNDIVDDEATKEAELLWLKDSLAAIIEMVLNNDKKLPGNIHDLLYDDAQNLIKELGISEQKSNHEKALEIVANTTEMLVSINSLRRTIANASFAGFKSWSKARDVVNKAASWFNKHPKTAGLMKSFALLGVVGGFVAGAIGSFMDWDNQSPEVKGQLIVESILLTIEVASEAFEIFKAIRANTATGTVTPEIQTATAILDDEQTRLIKKDSTKVGNLDQESTIKTGNQMHNEADLIESKPQHIDPEKPITPVEAQNHPQASRKFNTAANWMRAAVIILSATLTVLMCVQMANQWNDWGIADKILMTLQVIQQSLQLFVDIAGFVAEGLLAFGKILPALFTSISTVLSVVGGVLAAIGVILLIIMIIVEHTKPPPETPVETWIRTVGLPFVEKLDAVPNQKLVYTVSPLSFEAKSEATITIKAENITDKAITLNQVSVIFQTGTDPSTLTSETSYAAWKPASDLKAGEAKVSNEDKYKLTVVPYLEQDTADDHKIYRMGLNITGKDPKDENKKFSVVVPAKSNITIEFRGHIQVAGTSRLELKETDEENMEVLVTFAYLERK